MISAYAEEVPRLQEIKWALARQDPALEGHLNREKIWTYVECLHFKYSYFKKDFIY